ncbi:MAG: MFS transporter [Pseudomonadota bacterium]
MAGSFREFKYGWPVVFASMIGIGLGMSPLPFYTLIVFSKELVVAFNWERSTVTLGLAVFTISAFFAAPLIGRLTDLLGVRRVVLTSIVTFSFAMMAFALNNGSTTLYFFLWGLLAFAGAGTLPITFTRAVNGWFIERRGLALGIALLTTGIFGGLAIRYAGFITAQYDWQTAYVAVGLLPLLISFPIAFFLLRSVDDPAVADKAAKHVAESPERAANVTANGMPFKQAMLDWRFWLLAYVFVPVSFSVGGPIPNIAFILEGKNFATADALLLASFIGYAVLVGRLVGGYLIDRLWAPGVAFVLMSMPVFTLIILTSAEPTMLQATIAVLLLGLAAGIEYDLMAFLVSKYFGIRNYGAIYGALYGFFALGAGLSPWAYNKAYEAHGSYDTVLTWAIWVLLAGVVPILLLGRYRHFKGTEIVAPPESADASRQPVQ